MLWKAIVKFFKGQIFIIIFNLILFLYTLSYQPLSQVFLPGMVQETKRQGKVEKSKE